MEKNNKIYWVAVIIIIGILLLFKYNQKFSIQDTLNSYTYGYEQDYNNYSIAYYSNTPFQDNTLLCSSQYHSSSGNLTFGELDNEIQEGKLVFNGKMSSTYGSGDKCGTYYQSYPNGPTSAYIDTNDIIVINNSFQFDEIDNISFSFNYDGTFNWDYPQWCDPQGTDEVSTNLYLSNNNEDTLLFSKNLPLSDANRGTDYNNLENVIIYKDLGHYYVDVNSVKSPLTSLTNDSYKIIVKIKSTLNCGATDDFAGKTVSQSFQITDLQFNYKNNTICYSKTCSELGKECGLQDNGCQAIIACGVCSNDSYCNNEGRCNIIPTTCSSKGLCADVNGTCTDCSNSNQQSCSDFNLCTNANGDCVDCSNATSSGGGGGGGGYFFNNQTNQTLCSALAKKCSDGSYVYENASNNCNYDTCPTINPGPNWVGILFIIAVIGVIIYIAYNMYKKNGKK